MFRGVMGQLEQGLVCAGAVVRLTYCFCLLPSWRYTCSNGSIRLDVTVLVGVCARLGYVLRGDGL